MNFLVKVLLLLVLLSAPSAKAETTDFLCDTAYQSALFLDHLGYNPALAAEKVNTEEHSPDACVVTYSLIISTEHVATFRTAFGLWQISKVVVAAVWSNGWKYISPVEYYTATKLKEA